MLVLNEQKFAEDLYLGKNKDVKSVYLKIGYVTRYQKWVLNYDDSENYTKTVEWMTGNHDAFSEYSYSSMIYNFIKKANKTPFYNIDELDIYSAELEKIMSLDDVKKEKIMFVLLCMAKFQKKVYNFDGGLVTYSLNKLFRDARVSIKSEEREFFIYDLIKDGFLKLPNKVDSNCFFIDFINEKGDIALRLKEAECLELPYEYLNYKNKLNNKVEKRDAKKIKGDFYIRCIKCGRLFKRKNRERICNDCLTAEKAKYKIIECQKCHKKFLVNIRDTVTKYCSSCKDKNIFLQKCPKCGKVFGTSKNDLGIVICPECSYSYMFHGANVKTIKCIDCGKEFISGIKDSRGLRCPECKYKALKEYDRERKTKS